VATFLQLQDAVASDTRFFDRAVDTGIQPQIKQHINEAIRAHQKDHFWFNEQQWSRSTEAGREFYALPAEYVAMFTISLNSPRTKLVSMLNDSMEEMEPYQGRPIYFALFANQYRLFPIPDGVYGLRLWGVRKYPDLVADGDENPWTNEAFELIREAAKARVFYSDIHKEEFARTAEEAAAKARADLMLETKRRQPVQEIRPFL